MTKKQHYMTRDERIQLEAYLRAGMSRSWIARKMGFCRKTIYNEIKRGECSVIKTVGGYYRDVTEYSADKAQQIHDQAQTAKGRQLKIGSRHDYARFLEDRVVEHRRSPAAALAEARAAGFDISICPTTFYSYIDKGVFLRITWRDLWQKGKPKKQEQQQVQRTPHPLLPQIGERPQPAACRLERGHWEMDLVVGAEGTGAVLLTLTERMTREEMIFKLADRKAATVRSIFDRLERQMGRQRFRERFRTITTDNGSEFMEYDKLVRSVYGGRRFEVYYCHSYAAWEKGTNENHNRMIRRFFPKGTDFTKVTRAQVREVQNWMNNYPRKILGWRTPAEAA